jgi:transcriptional regulator with XRE-family HTH domain
MLTYLWATSAVDTPLRRRRLQMGITQRHLAQQCGVTVTTIARYEQGARLPRGEELECLIRETGLNADALVRPTQFLAEHPAFLPEYAAPEPRRGRPPRRESLHHPER